MIRRHNSGPFAGPANFVAALLFAFALSGCAGARPISVSDTIYSAPDTPAVAQAAVLERASVCWPRADPRIATLRLASDPAGPGRAPSVRLLAPVPEGQQQTPDTPPVFAMEFRNSASGQTDMVFVTEPEDSEIARRLKDDVLLWANGSKACG